MSINGNYNQEVKHVKSAKITKESLINTFKESGRLNAMLSIFNAINSFDNIENHENDLSSFGLISFSNRLDNGKDDFVNDWELDNYLKLYGKKFSEEVTKEDIKDFLKYANENGKAIDEEDAKQESLQNEKIAQKLGVNKTAIDKIASRIVIGENSSWQLKVVVENGKRFIKATLDEKNHIIYDMQGNIVEEKGDGYANGTNRFGELGDDSDEFTNIAKFKNGELVSETFINETTGEMIKYEGNSELRVKDGVGIKRSVDKNNKVKIDELVFDNGEKGKTKLELKYDKNGNLTGLDVQDEKNKTPKEKPLMKGYGNDYWSYREVLRKSDKKENQIISEQTLKMIKDLFDNGAKYGQDFDLEVKDGKINVKPKIKNETEKPTPELKGDALEQYKHLVTNNAHANEDFEVEYDEDGNFVYNYLNNQAREYGVDFKTEKYDKNGNKIYSMIVKNGVVTEEKMVDGKMQTTNTPLDDKLLDMCKNGDYAGANRLMGPGIMNGGYNFYPLADKYKEETGRELILDAFYSNQPNAHGLCRRMTGGYFAEGADVKYMVDNYNRTKAEFENIVNFDPYKSPIADMLPRISRTQQDANLFIETHNGKTYNVSIGDKKITVSLNGQSYNIDTSRLSKEFTQRVLSKLNAQVLYDMAINKINLKFDEKLEGAHGEYISQENTIVIDPNSTVSSRMIQMISHEAGHMMDYIHDKDAAVNAAKELLKDASVNWGRNKPITVEEILESNGDLASVSRGDTTLKQLYYEELAVYEKADVKIDSEAEYAANGRVSEFLAEAYALLISGTAQSEYVLCNYFPKSLARVKEIIESNRAHKLNQ